jgi:hypothetical protein
MDDSTLEEVESLIIQRFNEIEECVLPEMLDPQQRDFTCTKICDYYKMGSPKKGVNFCKYVHDQIQTIGIDKVVKKHRVKGFKVDEYDEPGAV